jgi:hypothetical protein
MNDTTRQDCLFRPTSVNWCQQESQFQILYGLLVLKIGPLRNSRGLKEDTLVISKAQFTRRAGLLARQQSYTKEAPSKTEVQLVQGDKVATNRRGIAPQLPRLVNNDR